MWKSRFCGYNREDAADLQPAADPNVESLQVAPQSYQPPAKVGRTATPDGRTNQNQPALPPDRPQEEWRGGGARGPILLSHLSGHGETLSSSWRLVMVSTLLLLLVRQF